MALDELLRDRLILVTGKGGTGKTTLAASIARVQAAHGRKTLLCEIDAQRAALAPVFGTEAGLKPVRIEANLDLCNLVWPDVLATYLQSMIRIKRVVNAILGNEMVRRFLDFTPGSQELVELSVVGDLVSQYDVVVVDMPASGHAFSMLDITRSALGLFRGGPIRARVETLRELVQDARTRLVFVALAEEMVVNETLETIGRIRDGNLLGGEPVVVLNRAIAPSFTEDERTLLERLSGTALSGAAEEFVAVGRWELSLETAVQDAIQRFVAVPGLTLQLVPPSGAGGNPRYVVGQVSQLFAAALGVNPEEVAWT